VSKTMQGIYLAGLILLGSLWVVWTGFKSAPVVLADEWIYRYQAAFQEASEFSIPNYLYSSIYGLASLFPDFYRAVQVFNLIFFIAFVIVVYFFARLFAEFWPSALLSFATLVSPLGLFVGLHMPESPYYFFVGLALLLFTKALVLSASKKAFFLFLVSSFLVLLASSFIKPHALFFLAGLLLALVLWSPRNLLTRVQSSILALGVGVSWIVSKLGIGYLIAGPNGLVIFGEGYEKTLFDQLLGRGVEVRQLALGESVAAAPATLPFDYLPLAGNFALLGVILAVAGYLGVRMTPNAKAMRGLLVVITLFAVLSLVILFFQVLITRAGDSHADRMLLRHFEFIAPFLLAPVLVPGVQTGKAGLQRNAVMASLVGLFALLLFPLGSYNPSISDSTMLYGFTGSRIAIALVVLLALILAFFSKFQIRNALSAVAVMALLSVMSQPLLSFRNSPLPVERAVEAYELVSLDSEIPQIYSFRKQDAAAFLFLLNRGMGDYVVVSAENSILDLESVSIATPVVVLGNIEVANGGHYALIEEGYTRFYNLDSQPQLAQREFPEKLELVSISPYPNQNSYGPVIKSDTIIELIRPINPGDTVRLTILGHNESTGGETVAFSLGGESSTLQLPEFSTASVFNLQFQNSAESNLLEVRLNGQNLEFTLSALELIGG
jgi:hypothetical protein